MTIVNLREIARYFSGAIFFDGEGAVEIKEASAFYMFPNDQEITEVVEGDGETPVFTTLFSWTEDDVNNGHNSSKFNIDTLLDTAKIKEMIEIKTMFKNLTDKQKREFLDYASQF
jgi:hypothetical protein